MDIFCFFIILIGRFHVEVRNGSQMASKCDKNISDTMPRASYCLVRARAKRNFQILNSVPGIVAQPMTNIPLMKGTILKRLDIC